MPSDPYPATPIQSSGFYSSGGSENDSSKRISYWKRKTRATRVVLGLITGVALVVATGLVALVHWLA